MGRILFATERNRVQSVASRQSAGHAEELVRFQGRWVLFMLYNCNAPVENGFTNACAFGELNNKLIALHATEQIASGDEGHQTSERCTCKENKLFKPTF